MYLILPAIVFLLLIRRARGAKEGNQTWLWSVNPIGGWLVLHITPISHSLPLPGSSFIAAYYIETRVSVVVCARPSFEVIPLHFLGYVNTMGDIIALHIRITFILKRWTSSSSVTIAFIIQKRERRTIITWLVFNERAYLLNLLKGAL